MSERGRVVLVVSAVAAAAAGGMFYLFKVHMPKKALAAAQHEIEAWEKRVAEARTCLLGERPASSDSAEALSVRELMPDPWNRGTCTKLIGQLSRGDGVSETGIPAIETAWEAADQAAAHVAKTFATHVDPFGERREERHKESPLPAALQELDRAHAALRAAAEMQPPASSTLPTLPAAEVVPVRDGTTEVVWRGSEIRPSAGGAIAFARAVDGDGAELEILLPAGGSPRATKVSGGLVRAVPDGAWGANVNDAPAPAAAAASAPPAVALAELTVGPVGDGGAFTAMSSHGVKAPATILALGGKQTDGFVVYTAADEIAIGRAAGGQPFALAGKPLGPQVRATSAIDLAGRAAVAWIDKDGAMFGTLLTAGAEPTVVPLGSGDLRAMNFHACLTATHAWFGDDPQFVRFDGKAAEPHVLAGFGLIACNDKFALLQRHGGAGVELAVCAESCRTAKISNLPYAAAVALVGDQVVAIRAHRGVLGVWRESGAPTFYRYVGNNFIPRFGHSDGKVLDVVGTLDDKRSAILRLPAR
ncbi:MAG: hypothetical protein SFX73_27890 [Kofleriaceae bacterium]|nr:hypothetical protein [Kofleriaceae bacterium]